MHEMEFVETKRTEDGIVEILCIDSSAEQMHHLKTVKCYFQCFLDVGRMSTLVYQNLFRIPVSS